MAKLPPNWDVAQLGVTVLKYNVVKNETLGFKNGAKYGAFAFAISKRTIKRLLTELMREKETSRDIQYARGVVHKGGLHHSLRRIPLYKKNFMKELRQSGLCLFQFTELVCLLLLRSL